MAENTITEYIYIIAYTPKQARFFFINQGYNNMYDYELSPVDEIPQRDFVRDHKCGDILGQYAVI